jgi:hypothetical protein
MVVERRLEPVELVCCASRSGMGICMSYFNRRNAFFGWLLWKVAKQVARRRLSRVLS